RFCTLLCSSLRLFLVNHPPPPEIYTLSLHDALPICLDDETQIVLQYIAGDEQLGVGAGAEAGDPVADELVRVLPGRVTGFRPSRSEEHTSELQSLTNIVCRLLLEKKKKNPTPPTTCH